MVVLASTVYHKEEQMGFGQRTPSEKFVLAAVRMHGSEHGTGKIERISRVVYDQDAQALVIWVRDFAGEEEALDLKWYDPAELESNLRNSGADFVRSVALMFFRHAGYSIHENPQAGGAERRVVEWSRQ